ncbi:hypothetical protein [Streptomyces sp. NRRL F-5053]|uniref:hypothetical protein n=1 Tax=Streptomyces sp. NRRL F-5053 TaxID=1463854 RepID=UPI0004C78659|nr:hypothetical protein [Streptomyces sp. NRRL F-5053]
MAVELDFLRSPLDFKSVLADLRPASWPPGDDDVQAIANTCTALIAGLYVWEGRTAGQNVTDTEQGSITTAQARRLLVREAALSYEGDVAVLLVPPGDRRVRVELRAIVEDYQGVLHRSELVLDWQDDDGVEHSRYVPLDAKGPQWYMLSQVRDDLRENRLRG